MSVCPRCGWTHVAADAYALNRWGTVLGYLTPDGEVHASREEAQEWLCEQRQSTTSTHARPAEVTP